jgi:uncharacterized protein YggE
MIIGEQMRKTVITILLTLFVLTGCSNLTLMQRSRTVAVTGSATLFAKADMATFSISVSEIAATTKEAQLKANEKVALLLEKIASFGIEEKDIKTTKLNIYPEYTYKDNERVLVGQRVSQTLFVTVRNIGEQSILLSSLIDSVGEVSSITINSITFGKEESEIEKKESRALAMQKAAEKAAEYAASANLTLGKAISISEEAQYTNQGGPVLRVESVAAFKADTSLPSGEIEISSTVYVVYQLK